MQKEPEKLSVDSKGMIVKNTSEMKTSQKLRDQEISTKAQEEVVIKRYRNPFNIFMSENKNRYKNLGRGYLAEMAKLWKGLEDDEKKSYILKSNQEKEEYRKLMAKYSHLQNKKKSISKSDFPMSKLKKILSEDS